MRPRLTTVGFEVAYAPEIASITPSLAAPPPTQPLPAPPGTTRSSLAAHHKSALHSRSASKAEAVRPTDAVSPPPETRTTRGTEKNRLSLGFLRQSSNEIADLLNGIGASNGDDNNRPSSRRSRSKSMKRRSHVSDGVDERNALRSRGSATTATTAPSMNAPTSAPRASAPMVAPPPPRKPPPQLERSVRSRDGGHPSDVEQERPQTSNSSVYTLSSGVGSVRKRLSLLKMGGGKKKAPSVKVGMVLEE